MISTLLELMVVVTNLAMRIFSMCVWLRNATSMFFMFEPPPVRMRPPKSLSAYSLGTWNQTFSMISSKRPSTMLMKSRLGMVRSPSMERLSELSMSLLSVKALPYLSFIFSASLSSIWSVAISLVILLLPRGITAR